MNFYLKIVLILFGLAYLISPVDIIPDLLLPFLGWIDDGVVVGTIIYLLRYGKLPNFLFKQQPPFQQPPDRKTTNFSSDKTNRSTDGNAGSNGPGSGKNNSNQKFPKNPYQILGIRPDASKKEIQAAYKDAVKKYHPDKLSHLGEAFSDLAKEKFIEIQEAYDDLMKLY